MSPWSPPLFLHAGSAVGNHRRPPEAVAGSIDADPPCQRTRAHPLLLEAEEREKHDRICNRVCSEGLLSGLLLAKPENSVACKVHTFLLHSLILSVSIRIPNLSTKKLKGLKQLSAPNKIQVLIQTMNRLVYVKGSQCNTAELLLQELSFPSPLKEG